MKKNLLLNIILVLGLTAAHGQNNRADLSDDYPFSVAFVSSLNGPNGQTGPTGQTQLVVFPLRGKPLRIPIQSLGPPFAYGPSGKALYGRCQPPEEPTKLALCTVDLETGRAAQLPGSAGLYGDLAVSSSENRILVSGLHRQNKDVWGLFELTQPGGRIRTLFEQADNNRKTAWGYLSISPGGESAVAVHNGRLQLIDIAGGTAEPFQEDFFMATWSPDGKWLAALEKGEKGRTILMDARDLTRRRILGPSELDWSPDSRYLLGMVNERRCGPYSGTLEAIDIETDKRTIIMSSQCQVNQATTGWVRSDVTGR